MIIQDDVFFGESGLSSTSANHIANLAKEFVKAAESKLSSFNFVTEEVALIGCDKQTRLAQGSDASALADMRLLLDQVVEAKALIAWLREAIKTKDNWISQLEAISNDDYERLTGEKLELEEGKRNVVAHDVVDSAFLSADERAQNLIADNICKHLDDMLGEGGLLADALNELRNVESNPYEMTDAEGALCENKPSLSSAVVEDAFAKLNEMRATAKKQCADFCQRVNEHVQQLHLDEDDALNKLNNVNADRRNVFNKAKRQYILKEKWRIAHLKIVIPNDLKPIYDKVSLLGK